jgi:hypothetical protein
MEDEHRAAASAALITQLDVAELDVVFAPSRHRHHPIR